MGIFDFLKKEENKEVVFPLSLQTTTEGTVVAMKDIPDPVFAEGMVGPCIGVDPTNGKIVAPCDGTIMQLSDTLHAFGIQGPGNALLMVHIGIDTVSMKGEGFTAKAKVGDKVKAGQTIVEVDFDKVREAGHPTVVMTILTNPKDFSAVDFTNAATVAFGDELIKLSKD
jgi:PTS system glucose-specific IIA component